MSIRELNEYRAKNLASFLQVVDWGSITNVLALLVYYLPEEPDTKIKDYIETIDKFTKLLTLSLCDPLEKRICWCCGSISYKDWNYNNEKWVCCDFPTKMNPSCSLLQLCNKITMVCPIHNSEKDLQEIFKGLF